MKDWNIVYSLSGTVIRVINGSNIEHWGAATFYEWTEKRHLYGIANGAARMARKKPNNVEHGSQGQVTIE